jgi:hypothetical protein
LAAEVTKVSWQLDADLKLLLNSFYWSIIIYY